MGIPKEFCTVKYPDFSEAVRMCMNLESEQIYVGKSNMSMAFRHVPLRVRDFDILILKAVHPVMGKTWWFVEKCLPFGSSISCAIFQAISDSITHTVSVKMQRPNVNYLDDYLFCEVMKSLCDQQVNKFLWVCDQIKFPVSLEKTFWGTQLLVFLGFLLDTVNKRVGIPVEKVVKALMMIGEFLDTNKTMVRKVQKLYGFLNFLCRAIKPGRAFTRRLYAMYTSTNGQVLKPHHHVRIKVENKLDLTVWKTFLTNVHMFTRSFVDFTNPTIKDVSMYSDASGNFKKGGFGAWCENSWVQAFWDTQFMMEIQPSIEYLELFAVTAGILAWIPRIKNSRIRLFCDNESICYMLNSSSSRCKHCMVLIRLVVLTGLVNNIKISCKHVKTKSNGRADALS